MRRTRYSGLWLLSGAMALVLAVACGAALSGGLTAVSAVGGIREQTLAAITVVSLLIGFTVALVAGLRDLASVARAGTASPPRRWIVGSLVALPIAFASSLAPTGTLRSSTSRSRSCCSSC
jgi:hypothetical protein